MIVFESKIIASSAGLLHEARCGLYGHICSWERLLDIIMWWWWHKTVLFTCAASTSCLFPYAKNTRVNRVENVSPSYALVWNILCQFPPNNWRRAEIKSRGHSYIYKLILETWYFESYARRNGTFPPVECPIFTAFILSKGESNSFFFSSLKWCHVFLCSQYDVRKRLWSLLQILSTSPHLLPEIKRGGIHPVTLVSIFFIRRESSSWKIGRVSSPFN